MTEVKTLPNARCKGDWTNVFGIRRVGNSFRLGNEFDHSMQLFTVQGSDLS